MPGLGGVPVRLFLDRDYFGRETVYGEPDDLLRYGFFCHAVGEALLRDDWIPDIVHLNDWQTAALAFALRNMSWSHARLRGTASVLTIHNLRYRGPDDYNDLLAQGIYYSDAITTVSPTYAREILSPERGEGLDSLLRMRDGSLRGILNGLDETVYAPDRDAHIPARFGPATVGERAVNRAALRQELGLPGSGRPLLGMVTRLTEQKGVDLVIDALPALVAEGADLAILGQGDATLGAGLRRMEQAHPGNVRLVDRFDDGLARRIYAGADIFLMPSRYEPCGLGQLIAMRYGCVPLARRTGGIADSVSDPRDRPEGATGFLFDDFSAGELLDAYRRAVAVFQDPAAWQAVQANGMRHDFSWAAAAAQYVEVYEAALRSRGMAPPE